jgi:spermidine/putrescine transport system ATP-binding protein
MIFFFIPLILGDKREQMTANVIELRGVSKSIHGQGILYDLNLEVRNGEFLTLLGPSGCGKTTLLRLISGFEEPTAGKIFINGKDVNGLPPHLRHVHTVFQSYALFPHMTVFENVAFGLRCQRRPKDEIIARVNEVLKIVKLEKFATRKPEQLSGGQQQRVAVARAVVNRPLVLLLDEPLSSLDYRLRKTMQIELKQLQRKLGITFIFVTHDQEEALSMSDRVVVMHDGGIEQVGTPRQVYEEPQSLSVARFIGEVNHFEGEVVQNEDKKLTLNVEGIERKIKGNFPFTMGEKCHVLVRPEDLRVWGGSELDESDKIDMYPGKVEEVIYKGTTVDFMVRLSNLRLVAATKFFNEDDERVDYTIGEPVWVTWLPGWEVVLPNET